jgi:hypothetical protein
MRLSTLRPRVLIPASMNAHSRAQLWPGKGTKAQRSMSGARTCILKTTEAALATVNSATVFKRIRRGTLPKTLPASSAGNPAKIAAPSAGAMAWITCTCSSCNAGIVGISYCCRNEESQRLVSLVGCAGCTRKSPIAPYLRVRRKEQSCGSRGLHPWQHSVAILPTDANPHSHTQSETQHTLCDYRAAAMHPCDAFVLCAVNLPKWRRWHTSYQPMLAAPRVPPAYPSP